MRAIPIHVLAPLALSLTAPFAGSAGAQDSQERSRSNQVQDARGTQGGARGNQTPEQRKAAQEKAAREKAAQDKAAQEKAQKRKQQQAREAAEKERQAGRQPDARPPQRRDADPASEQEKLEQRKKNARAQQQQGAGGGAGSKGRGAMSAAQRGAVNQWAAEMRLHRERVARIERLKEIAATGKQRERVTELDQLLTRETKRHESKLARIEGALDPAVLRQLQARSSKAGGANPQRREAPPAEGARKAPADGARKAPAEGARKAPVDGARKGATGGARSDAAGTKGDKGSTRQR